MKIITGNGFYAEQIGDHAYLYSIDWPGPDPETTRKEEAVYVRQGGTTALRDVPIRIAEDLKNNGGPHAHKAMLLREEILGAQSGSIQPGICIGFVAKVLAIPVLDLPKYLSGHGNHGEDSTFMVWIVKWRLLNG